MNTLLTYLYHPMSRHRGLLLSGNGDADDGYNPYTAAKPTYWQGVVGTAGFALDVGSDLERVGDVLVGLRKREAKKSALDKHMIANEAHVRLARDRGVGLSQVEEAIVLHQKSYADRVDRGVEFDETPLLNDGEIVQFGLAKGDVQRLDEIVRLRKDAATAQARAKMIGEPTKVGVQTRKLAKGALALIRDGGRNF